MFRKITDYSEEEIAAISLIQRAYQTKRARDHVKIMVRQNYIKLFDRINQDYVYKNKMTGEIKMEKPKFLGEDGKLFFKMYNKNINLLLFKLIHLQYITNRFTNATSIFMSYGL